MSPDLDRESQPERTRLAWRRAVLAAAVVGLLLARLAISSGAWWLVPVAVAVWLAGAVGAQSRLADLAAGRTLTRRAPVLAVLVVVGYVVMGVALIRVT